MMTAPLTLLDAAGVVSMDIVDPAFARVYAESGELAGYVSGDENGPGGRWLAMPVGLVQHSKRFVSPLDAALWVVWIVQNQPETKPDAPAVRHPEGLVWMTG